MKISEVLLDIARCYDTNMVSTVVSYDPREGLYLWWIESGTDWDGFKSPEFVKLALQHKTVQGWNWRSEYCHMDNHNTNIEYPDFKVFGKDPFIKSYVEFNKMVKSMGIDEDDVVHVSQNTQDAISAIFTQVRNVPATISTKPVVLEDEFPITYKVDGQEFKTMSDVEKYINYQKLAKITFGDQGALIPKDVQRYVIANMLKNQSDVVKYLKGM